MEAVAAKVMGPRPGIFVIKFWQGVVEIILRVILTVLSIANLVASSLALSQALSLPDPSSLSQQTNNLVESTISLNYVSIIANSLSASGVGIGISILALPYEIVIIVLRFVNIGLLNYKIKIFFSIDIIITFIIATVFGIAGILAAFVASPWTDLAENSALLATNGFGSLPRVRDVYAVAAGTNLGCALFASFLMVWIVLFLIQKWNKKVVKETVKGAIL